MLAVRATEIALGTARPTGIASGTFGFLTVATLIALILPVPAYARSGGPYELTWFTVDGGGVTSSSAGAFALGGTIAQPDAGNLSGGLFILRGGFWHFAAVGPPGDGDFIRGDADGDGVFNGLNDALFTLVFQFQGGAEPPCLESADSDGDGVLNGLNDALYTLTHQFQSGPPPPAPYPACGVDPDPSTSVGCDIPPMACRP